MKHIFIAIFVTALFFTLWFVGVYPKAFYYVDVAFGYINENFVALKDNVAAVLLHQPVTVADLQNAYDEKSPKNVRVLIVAGHEPGYGGAEYANLKEREMNVELASDLAAFLKNDGHYDVMVSRDNNEWNPVLADYFKNNWDSIIAFFKDNKGLTSRLVHTGRMGEPSTIKVTHNKAPQNVAYRLYGINKWENENSIDIAIHIHFNDNPRADTSVPGKYSGFAIYVPEQHFANSTTTNAVAQTIFNRLSKYNPVSNLSIEDEGIVQESDLIAIGAYNTTNSASMLIEYGYIYEPQFGSEPVRTSVLKDLAFQTYMGLQDFFGVNQERTSRTSGNVAAAYETLMLPHSWKDTMTKTQASPSDILSLQTALLLEGEYPTQGKTMNDCPRTGKLGSCTWAAVSSFQKKYQIKGEEGTVGDQTKKILNSKYSGGIF